MSKTLKKTLSVLLSLAMLAVFLPAAVSFAADEIHITTADDFTAFVSGDAAANAVLDADIDLGEWAGPAFTDGYSGTFNGGGHTIRYTVTAAAANFRSLFHTIAAGGVVKNLNVSGSITVAGNRSGRNYHAGVAYMNQGTVEGCVSSVNISCATAIAATKNVKYAGGVTAVNTGLVKDCVYEGVIENITTYGGGIVAENRGGSIIGCVNNGSVTVVNASGYAGGIVGCVTSNGNAETMVIENCVNKGAVTGASGDYSFAGGVIGQINVSSAHVTAGAKLNIIGCSNTGALSAGGNTADGADHTYYGAVSSASANAGFAPNIEAGAPAHEHTYDDGVETVTATCTRKGEITYTCTSCDEATEGHTYTVETATIPHVPGEWILDEYEGVETYVKKCSECGNVVDVDENGAVAFLNNAKKALSDAWFRLDPAYGADTNVCDMLSSELEQLGFSGVSVSVKAADNPADGTAAIGKNGDITYFYADPGDTNRFVWTQNIPVAFSLEKGGKAVDYSANAVIKWDAAKVRAVMEERVAALVTEDTIRGGNEDLSAVTENLTLYKAVDDGEGGRLLWTLIQWESSDEDVIAVDDSAQGSADTLFEPYIGKVRRSMEDKTVTLTATFNFQRTSAYGEAPITLTKEFTVTVKGIGDDLLGYMQGQLDANYTAEKLTYSGTKQPVDPNAVTGDVQLLLPRTSGIDNSADYKFTAESSDDSVAKVNSYRLYVYRPLPGEPARQVTLTVRMAHKNYSDLSVTKDITLTVAPLTQEEIDHALALMEKAKAAFFEGINDGANESPDRVTENLHPFYEAVDDGHGGLRWIYTNAEATGAGISAVSIDESRPSEQWDRFYSTDPSAVSHETLLVTPQAEEAVVTVKACLSAAQYERYAALYPDNADFAKLARQEVSATLTVPGTGETPSEDPTTPDAPVTPDQPEDGGSGSMDLSAICDFFLRLLKFLTDLLLTLGAIAGSF